MRKSVYAGSFYQKQSQALISEIEACFTGEKGPGDLPLSPKKKSPVKAVLVPHAAYQFSGMAAAWAYKEIAESAIPDLFIILAPNHNSAESGISVETFQTPLGEVRVDQEFARSLAEKGTVPINDEIHVPEHAIEIQLPMLQHALKGRSEQIKILPLLVSSDVNLDKLAIDIKETLIDLKRTATFIVSSDLTHYGRNYKYMPFYKDIPENLVELDKRAIDAIISGNQKVFSDFIDETEDTVCGFFPILLFLKTVRFNSARAEQYYVSGDITGDYKNCVSYASIIFE